MIIKTIKSKKELCIYAPLFERLQSFKSTITSLTIPIKDHIQKKETYLALKNNQIQLDAFIKYTYLFRSAYDICKTFVLQQLKILQLNEKENQICFDDLLDLGFYYLLNTQKHQKVKDLQNMLELFQTSEKKSINQYKLEYLKENLIFKVQLLKFLLSSILEPRKKMQDQSLKKLPQTSRDNHFKLQTAQSARSLEKYQYSFHILQAQKEFLKTSQPQTKSYQFQKERLYYHLKKTKPLYSSIEYDTQHFQQTIQLFSKQFLKRGEAQLLHVDLYKSLRSRNEVIGQKIQCQILEVQKHQMKKQLKSKNFQPLRQLSNSMSNFRNSKSLNKLKQNFIDEKAYEKLCKKNNPSTQRSSKLQFGPKIQEKISFSMTDVKEYAQQYVKKRKTPQWLDEATIMKMFSNFIFMNQQQKKLKSFDNQFIR